MSYSPRLHSMGCSFPEGCSCGASDWNSLLGKLNELQKWKESALAVEREWNAQEIAKLLGATPGQSCRRIVQERVPALVTQNTKLRKTLDEVLVCHEMGCLGEATLKGARDVLQEVKHDS